MSSEFSVFEWEWGEPGGAGTAEGFEVYLERNRVTGSFRDQRTETCLKGNRTGGAGSPAGDCFSNPSRSRSDGLKLQRGKLQNLF